VKCRACAYENPPGQPFCGGCGARLAAGEALLPPVNFAWPDSPAPAYTPAHLAEKILTLRAALEGERKPVTVVFCDIAGSTALAHRLGAEAMHTLLDRFFHLALAEVHRYEGTINQFLGDGFMALFGAPLAHEDHARRALLAALGLRERLAVQAVGDGLLREVNVRMGVHSGSVVVGTIGDNLRMDYTAVGDTTNLAARLQQQAEPGAIRVSAATRRAAASRFAFKSLGLQTLKGVAEPVEAFELLPAGAADANRSEAHAPIGSPLVGRNAELAVLLGSIDALCQGRGSVVVATGEPGAGKSRLVLEARSKADGRSLLWLEGRALSFGRSLSYWPFAEVLKHCFGIEETDTEAQALRKLEHTVDTLFDARAEEIVPYVATVLALETGERYRERLEYLDAQALGRQVFLSLYRLFERLAEREPVLLVMEDWHWFDRSSVALCEHLLGLASAKPLAFWFVSRADAQEPLARIRAAAGRHATLPLEEIALAPLSAGESEELITNLLGDRVKLPEALRSAILRKTEGNPFFIEEVVRSLVADGTLVRDPREVEWQLTKPIDALVLPDTVQGVILARIDRLEEGVKNVLKLASVIGRSFLLRILEAISATSDAVETGLTRLEAAELVRLRMSTPELEYVFKHALVQEAAYGSLLVERRRAIHRRVAAAIERLFAERAEEFTSMLAFHYVLAEDWPKAHDYLLKAGDQSGRMAADAEALEHYRRAETTYMKSGAEALSHLERATLDRKLGQALYGVGRYEEAVEHLSRALAHLGVRYPRSRAGVRRSIAAALGWHFLRRIVRGRPVIRMQLDFATAQEISAAAHLLSWLDFFVDAERFVLDGLIELDAGERGGDVLACVRGLTTLGVILMAMGALSAARRPIEEAVLIAHASGSPAAIGNALFARGWHEWATGALDASISSCVQGAAAYQGVGDVRGWGGMSCYLCWLALQRGDFAAATATGTEMLDIARRAGDPHVVTLALSPLTWVELATGPLEEAAARSETVRKIAIEITSYRMQAAALVALGRCRLLQGRLQEAAARIGEGVALLEARHMMRGLWSAYILNAHAEVCLAQVARLAGPDRREAMRCAKRACKAALRRARNAARPWLPEALRLQGRLNRFSGNTAAARRRWQESLDEAEQMGMPVERARTLLEMCEAASDAALVDEAIRAFEHTGARIDLAFALHARAILASGGAAALERYDAAIAALDAVGAQYRLGRALTERAQLHRLSGRPVDARADLAAACARFIAAGAERAEVEQLSAAGGV